MNLELPELYLNPHLFIARSETHRWGVFTRKKIKKHDCLQESPYCTFKEKEIKRADVIGRYVYSSEETEGAKDYVLGFGFAAMFNHCPDHNAAYELDVINEVMRHYATEDIKSGEEIFIDYGCGWDDDWGKY